jgi:hypothetical protein
MVKPGQSVFNKANPAEQKPILNPLDNEDRYDNSEPADISDTRTTFYKDSTDSTVTSNKTKDKIDTNELKEKLNSLYEAREPLAEEFNKLVLESMNIQDKINLYKSWESSYDPIAFRSCMAGFNEELRTIQEKMSYSTLTKSLHDVEEKIINLEKKLGTPKLTGVRQLTKLYVNRDHDAELYQQMQAEKTLAEEKISVFKKFESSYPESEFKEAIKLWEEALQDAELAIANSPISESLYNIEEKIITKEKAIYGEAKTEHIASVPNRYR